MTARYQRVEEVSNFETPSLEGINRDVKRESTRSSIAISYVLGFLATVVLGGGAGLYLLGQNKLEIQDVKDLLVTISGILSGPLGFIIGYYFKAKSE